MNATQGESEPLAPNAPTNGHDADGRFAPGNAGGPGNPFARRVAELRPGVRGVRILNAAGGGVEVGTTATPARHSQGGLRWVR